MDNKVCSCSKQNYGDIWLWGGLLLMLGIGVMALLRSSPRAASAYSDSTPNPRVGKEYNNAESWQLTRGTDGHISEVVIHRHAIRSE